jgi:hypothetical protein
MPKRNDIDALMERLDRCPVLPIDEADELYDDAINEIADLFYPDDEGEDL